MRNLRRAFCRSTVLLTVLFEVSGIQNPVQAAFVAYNDHEAGPGTHEYTTTYGANGVASGFLVDIETGEPTSVTLTTSASGVQYASQTANPAEGTDAGNLFLGYVDFSPNHPHSLEVAGSDTYTHAFSGLDPSARYDFAGTAVRGVEQYTDRWTLVTLLGAESFTPAHSSGIGVVTDGLEPNQVAIWTGQNNLPDQGFVARWIDIDPGSDGEFSVVSSQYQGPTPGVGSGNSTGASKGYGLNGIRLAETSVEGQPMIAVAPASDVTGRSALIRGEVIDPGADTPQIILAYGGTDGGNDLADWEQQIDLGAQSESFSHQLTDLNPGTEYYFRVHAENSVASFWIAPAEAFTTTIEPPAIVNLPATEIQAFTAKAGFNVSSTGGEIPEVIVFYGQTDGDTTMNAWDQSVPAGTQSGEGSVTLTGLEQSTTYYFRAVAGNSAGQSWASDTQSFTTTEIAPPLLEARDAENIQQFSAQLRGAVADNGGDPPEVTLFYGITDGGESSNWDHQRSLGVQDGEFSVLVEDLEFDTQYYYRFRAENAGGVAWSPATQEFRTLPVVPATVSPLPAASISDQSAVLRGQILDDGGSAPQITFFFGSTDGGTSASGWDRFAAVEAAGSTFSLFVDELTPDTTYFFRTRAVNAAGESWSETAETFRTLAFVPLTVVINEVHYAPADKTSLSEFIEFYNAGDETVDMSGWYFSDGVDYVFPDGTSLASGAYYLIAQSSAGFQGAFGFAPDGQWEIGDRLSNEGETITLRNIGGEKIDEVDYQTHFPWPTEPSDVSRSMELLNPAFDNDLGGSWRASVSGPTPGARNSVFRDNDLPALRQVEHTPESPRSTDDVIVTAKITDADGIANVSLDFQIVPPGDYIAIDDPRYETRWSTVSMNDNGTGSDLEAGDSIYTTLLSSTRFSNRTLVRYRIRATDTLGATTSAPYDDDPQPNFAFFVYDGVPSWTGSARPGVEPPVTYSGELLDSIPVYQLITTRTAHEESQHIPDATTSGYTGSDYRWKGTLVYDGKVYDHIRFRARGGVWRYSMGKNMWKFDFNSGHSFQARDDYGRKYDTKWSKLNFSALIQQGNFEQRGEQGLFEAVGFKLHNLADNPAPDTHYVHFRIIENASEEGPTDSQFDDDFQGLYLAVEQPDGRFLDEHDLPDGNFYKMEGGSGELNNQGPTQPTNKSDLNDFLSYTSGTRTTDWWKQNLNLDQYYSFRVIATAIHDYDIHAGKNYFFYHNPDTDQWWVINWDIDLTWTTTYGGGGERGPFSDYVLAIPEFATAHKNRMREVRDLLFNPEQVDMMIDETAQWVYTPGQPSFVDADRAMWDYNPILISSYVNLNKAGHGRFYEAARERNFGSMMEHVKDYVVTRSQWIDSNILTDDALVPRTPSIDYIGAAGFPLDDLRFSSSSFSSPSGASFAAMEWRLARVTDVNSPSFDPMEPRHYEITPTWESGVLTSFNSTIQIPHDDLKTDRTYRARVRMRDTNGRWSHWSEPIQFVPGDPTSLDDLQRDLVITEVMYNPPDKSFEEEAMGYSNSDFEYIELWNRGDLPLDLSDVRFTHGIDFDFINGAIQTLDPGAYALVVRDQGAIEFRYGGGLPIAGEYKDENENKLANEGDEIKLSFGNGVSIHQFTYQPALPWPESANGGGYSLTLRDPQNVSSFDLSESDSWTASSRFGGTPGGPDVSETLDPYETWRAIHFDVNEPDYEQISARDADADLDGSLNFLEMAFGTDPRDPDSLSLPIATVVVEGGSPHLEITYRRLKNPSGIVYQVQSSTDLIHWTNSNDFELVTTAATNDPEIETVAVRHAAAITDSSQTFFRLAIPPSLE